MRLPRVAAVALPIAVAACGPPPGLDVTGAAPPLPLTLAPAERVAGAIDERELAAFAEAYAGVLAVQRRYVGLIRAAEGPERRRRLGREATAEMRGVVAARGIAAERYNDLVLAMRRRPALRRQVERLLEAARFGGMSGG